MISSSTFDILERMAVNHPELRGGFARGTGGVDVDLVVAVFAKAITAKGHPLMTNPDTLEAGVTAPSLPVQGGTNNEITFSSNRHQQ